MSANNDAVESSTSLEVARTLLLGYGLAVFAIGYGVFHLLKVYRDYASLTEILDDTEALNDLTAGTLGLAFGTFWLLATTAYRALDRWLSRMIRQPGDRTSPRDTGSAPPRKEGPADARLDVRLIKAIPGKRLRRIAGDSGNPPGIGDLGIADHGFTGSFGRPMVLAYFFGKDGVTEWEAEVFESELESVDTQPA